jgi:hypothetical protein
MERNAGREVPFQMTAGLHSRVACGNLNTAPRHIVAAACPLLNLTLNAMGGARSAGQAGELGL